MLYSAFPESILGKAMQGHTRRLLGLFMTSITTCAAGNTALPSHFHFFQFITAFANFRMFLFLTVRARKESTSVRAPLYHISFASSITVFDCMKKETSGNL